MPVPTFTLNTGASIPAIGLGGWAGTAFEVEKRENADKWILNALKSGYRHIDTAQAYGTEKAVGKAVRASGIPREEIFVTTKLPWHHGPYVQRSFDESMENLGLDYVDLYLVHFPQVLGYPTGYDAPAETLVGYTVLETPTFQDVWAEMEKIYASGRARAIGVSNFSIKTLNELLEKAKIVPAVNQVELHPHLAQTDLVEYAKSKGIIITAYTPTGYSQVLNEPLIASLASKYNVSPAQIVLAWHIARGVTATPKSENPGRQLENINVPTLEEEDVKQITSLDRNERVCNVIGEDGLVHGWSAERMGW